MGHSEKTPEKTTARAALALHAIVATASLDECTAVIDEALKLGATDTLLDDVIERARTAGAHSPRYILPILEDAIAKARTEQRTPVPEWKTLEPDPPGAPPPWVAAGMTRLEWQESTARLDAGAGTR